MSVTSSHIRPLRPADREPIGVLLAKTGVFTEEEVAIALELVDAVLGRPDQKDYHVAVYDEGGVVRGYYCIGPTPATQGTYDLYWIAVDRAAQGRGIGGTLEEHACASVRAMGGRLLVAETSSQETYGSTRAFYRAHGYEEGARIRDYYRIGDDLVVYCKTLTR
ncbi:MAG: GNAT family N-acetyltransferase [Bacteroidota bacterium]